MATRNKYDVDETLETPFSLKHFKRAAVYAKRHTKRMVFAMLASMTSALSSLVYPMILQRAFDVVIPSKDYGQLGLLTVVTVLTIALSIAMNTVRARLMTRVGQDII